MNWQFAVGLIFLLIHIEAFCKISVIFQGVSSLNIESLQEQISYLKKNQIKKFLISKYKSKGFFNANISLLHKGEGSYIVEVKEGDLCKIKSIKVHKKRKELKNLSHFYRATDEVCSNENKKSIERILKKKLLKENYFRYNLKSYNFVLSSDKKTAILYFDFDNLDQLNLKFIGNKKISTRRLLRDLDLDEYFKVELDFEDYLFQKIKISYYNLGYTGTKIKIEEKKGLIIASIQEGSKVLIDEIRIKGRFSRPVKYYINYILKNSSEFIKLGYFNIEDFELTLSKLSNHIRNEGYVEFELVSKNYKFSKNEKKVSITLNLNEGSIAVIGEINFIGAERVSYKQLSKVLGLKVGSPLNFYKLEGSFEKLKSFYNSFGYLEMKLKTDSDIIKYDEGTKEARLNLKIEEGQQIKIKNIFVKGLRLTKNNFVVKLSGLKQGDVLTSEKITQAISNLDNSDLFSFVNIDFEKTKESQRNLTILVQEIDPGEIRTGIGLNKESGISGKIYGELFYKNIKGKGRQFRLFSELKNNFTYPKLGLDYNITTTYVEPFLLGGNLKGIAKTSLGKQVTQIEVINKENKISFERTRQLGFFIEKKLNYNIFFQLNLWSLEVLNHFTIKGSETVFDDGEKVSLIGPSLYLDYRDNQFLPTKGFYFNWNLFYSAPFAGSSEGIHFLKTENTFNYYNNFNIFVLAQMLRVGFLKNLSSSELSGVPKSYAFFLGGDSTLRGYRAVQPNERLPFSDDFRNSGEDPDNTKSFIKDKSYLFLYKAETRIPLFGRFNSVLFYDLGAVFVSHIKQKKPFAHSTGFGIRYKTPIGTINIEWAFKLGQLRKIGEPKKTEPRYRIHFSLGSY